MLFSLRLSLTVLHGKYLAADACGRLLPGHVCLPLFPGCTATQRENCSIHGDEGGVQGGWLFKCCRQEDLGISEVQKRHISRGLVT